MTTDQSDNQVITPTSSTNKIVGINPLEFVLIGIIALFAAYQIYGWYGNNGSRHSENSVKNAVDAQEDKVRSKTYNDDFKTKYPLGSTVFVGDLRQPASVVGWKMSGFIISRDGSVPMNLENGGSVTIFVNGILSDIPVEALRASIGGEGDIK